MPLDESLTIYFGFEKGVGSPWEFHAFLLTSISVSLAILSCCTDRVNFFPRDSNADNVSGYFYKCLSDLKAVSMLTTTVSRIKSETERHRMSVVVANLCCPDKLEQENLIGER